jgi:cytochrome c-type biogenesis protein CcmH
MFWIIIAILTAAVAAVLIFPLMRKPETADTEGEGEAAVYRDQMRELERERQSGLIGETEAGYARAEIGRRLLAASSTAPGRGKATASSRRHSAAVTFITVLLPATGLCLYLTMGSPDAPDMPLAARLAEPGNNMDLLVAKAERHLAENPEDGAGWDILAPIYFKSMRLGDAELAYRNAIRLLGVSPERLSGLGETLVAANDGIVTEDARIVFENAVRLQPGNPRARFYVGLAFEQAGKLEEARGIFQALMTESPQGAPWLPLVREHLAKSGGAAIADQGVASANPAAPSNPAAPGNPTAGDVAAAETMTPADRQAMILGMVESLDARLRENPDNFEGWMRLVQSYVMLKNTDKAEEAVKTGLKTFPADGDQGKQLVALARQLGLSIEGVTQ